MSSYNATFFLAAEANAHGNASVYPVLYIEPDGRYGGGRIVFQIPAELAPDEQVKVAERILAGVTGWRDEIVAKVKGERTAADELEAARAEIARLKTEAGEAS